MNDDKIKIKFLAETISEDFYEEMRNYMIISQFHLLVGCLNDTSNKVIAREEFLKLHEVLDVILAKYNEAFEVPE